MSRIIVPQRRIWTRQPTQHAVRSGELIVSPYSKQWNKTGALSVIGTDRGAAFSADYSSGAALAGPQRKLLASDFGKNTFIAVIRMVGSISTAQSFAGGGASGQYVEEFRIGDNATNNVFLKFRDTAQNALQVSYITGQPRLVANAVNVIAWRVHSSSSIEAWLNGVRLQETPTSTGFNETSFGSIPGSQYAVNNFWYNGAVTQSSVSNLNLLMFARIFGRNIDLKSASLNPWQLFARRPRRTIIDFGASGTTAVYADSALTYYIRSILSSDSGVQYAIRNAIYHDDAVGYYLRNAIATNNEVGYILRSAIAKDDAEAYKIRGLIQADDAEAYNVRGLVQTTDSETYSIRGLVQTDATSNYDIQSSTSVATANTASYSVRGSVSSDGSPSYAVRGAIQSDASAGYSVRASAYRDVVSSYAIDAAESVVYADLTTSYSIDGVAPACPTADQIAAAVLAQLNATTIPVNVTHFNGNPTVGSGTPADPVRPA